MFSRNQLNQLSSVRCPEQGGTGMRSMPERDGTGATRMPEQGGTGIRRLGQFFALLCLAIPTAALHAQGESWSMSGEARGTAQISMVDDQRIQMGFMLQTKDEGLRHFTAIGPSKNGFARLQLFLIDVSGKDADLVPYGSIELFLETCGAYGEMHIKSEADGSGGKSEADGSGGKSEADGSGGKSEADGSGSKTDSRVFSLASSRAACVTKSEADGSGAP